MNRLSILLFLLILLGCEKNHSPEIISISYSPQVVIGGNLVTLIVDAVDQDGDPLTYEWSATEGDFTFGENNFQARWRAPFLQEAGSSTLGVKVSDGIETVYGSVDVQIGKTLSGSISGYVYFSGTSMPISGATIKIQNFTISSDSLGKFSLGDIPVGTYSLVAVKGNYDSYSGEVTIRANRNERITIYMGSRLFTTNLSGILTGDHSGSPKSGLSLVILNPDGSHSLLKSVSSPTGFYQILSIPQGTRTLLVLDSDKLLYEEDILLDDAEYTWDISIPELFEFTDQRDGNSYAALKMGDQTWMTENLAYLPFVSPSDIGSDDESFCYVTDYEGSDVSEAKEQNSYKRYGVLYNWSAATSDTSGNGPDICPDGWHLPSDEEWMTLEKFLGMSLSEADTIDWRNSGAVGSKIKSDFGWDLGGNGDNSSGFQALPAGNRAFDGGFYSRGTYTGFWSSSADGSTFAWARYLYYDNDGVYRGSIYRRVGYSVRCVMD